MTPAEKKLWVYLRGSQFKNFKFRRQYSVGNYVVDFYCPELRLSIEIDGDSYFVAGARKYDEHRGNFIKSFKISCLRFTNQEVAKDIEGVLLKLEKFIGDHPQPSHFSPARRASIKEGETELLPLLRGGWEGFLY